MLDGKTKVLGVIGNPIGHSLSPLIQNAMIKAIGLNAIYVPFEITDVAGVMNGIKSLGMVGINVTIPHKNETLKCMDVVSDEAKALGAVNTVVNKDGVLFGYNTDVLGFYEALCFDGISIKDKNILIIGAGGAAKGVAYCVSKFGARRVDISNRTEEKAKVISDMIKDIFGVESEYSPSGEIKYEVIINTTSVGMEPYCDMCPICDYSIFEAAEAVVDIIYKPKTTVFIQKAKECGVKKIAGGLNMLIFQAIYALELFLDRELDKDKMFSAIDCELKKILYE